MKGIDHAYVAELVSRAQQNDSDAFAEIYALTYNKVYNYACHYLNDTYLAQDALQDVYILALKNIQKLGDPLLFIAWLNQICFHVCYDMCKSRNTHYGVSDESIWEVIQDEHIDSNPESCVVERDRYERLNKAIEQLDINEREVVIMRYYNNMKIDDIVNTTALSRSTVKRYLQNALNNIAKNMKE